MEPHGSNSPEPIHHPLSRKPYREATLSRRIHLPAAVRLRGARKVLELAASRRLHLDEIAVLFGVNRDHLLKIFRRAGFPSPMRQVRRISLDRVAEELRTTKKSLETLARESGYADGSSLRRAIRRAFGHPPEMLRNSRENL